MGSGVVVLEASKLDVLEVDEDVLIEVDEELLEVLEVVLELVEEELLDVLEIEAVEEDELEVVEDELLDESPSGFSSPQPVRSAAARIAAKIVAFFIKTLLEANIFLLYHIFVGLSRLRINDEQFT